MSAMRLGTEILTPVAIRHAVTRWRMLSDLLHTCESIFFLNCDIDFTLKQQRTRAHTEAATLTDRVERRIERLRAQLDVEVSRLTVDAAQAYHKARLAKEKRGTS